MKMEKKTKSAMISGSEKLLYVIKPHQKVGYKFSISIWLGSVIVPSSLISRIHLIVTLYCLVGSFEKHSEFFFKKKFSSSLVVVVNILLGKVSQCYKFVFVLLWVGLSS